MYAIRSYYESGLENNFNFEILQAVMRVNEGQKTVLYPKIRNYFKGDLKGKRIAFWGLAFKPDTDDIREAPSLYMIEKLTADGAEVVAYDPEAMENVRNLIGDKIKFAKNEYEALQDSYNFV